MNLFMNLVRFGVSGLVKRDIQIIFPGPLQGRMSFLCTVPLQIPHES